jgi:hypothetical protein
MQTKTKPEPEPILSFRVPAEERARLEEMAARMDAPLSSAARIVLRRGLEQPPEILV